MADINKNYRTIEIKIGTQEVSSSKEFVVNFLLFRAERLNGLKLTYNNNLDSRRIKKKDMINYLVPFVLQSSSVTIGTLSLIVSFFFFSIICKMSVGRISFFLSDLNCVIMSIIKCLLGTL